MCAMVGISLQLAEKPFAAGVLDDQEARAAGCAHEHAVGFSAQGWLSVVIAELGNQQDVAMVVPGVRFWT